MRVRKLGDVHVPKTFLSGWLVQQRRVDKKLAQYKDDVRDVSSHPIKQFLHDELTQVPNTRSRKRYDYPLRTFHEGRRVVGQDFVEASDLEWNRQMQLKCNKDALPPLPSKLCYPDVSCDKCEVKLVVDYIHNVFTQPPEELEAFRVEPQPSNPTAGYTEDHCCCAFPLPMYDNLIAPNTTPISSSRSSNRHDVHTARTEDRHITPRFVVIPTGGADVKHSAKLTGRSHNVGTRGDMKKRIRPPCRCTQVSHNIPEKLKVDQLAGHSLKLQTRPDFRPTSATSDVIGYPHRLRLPHIYQ